MEHEVMIRIFIRAFCQKHLVACNLEYYERHNSRCLLYYCCVVVTVLKCLLSDMQLERSF